METITLRKGYKTLCSECGLPIFSDDPIRFTDNKDVML